jgi:hypoxanthine phosphoribosyltransferase
VSSGPQRGPHDRRPAIARSTRRPARKAARPARKTARAARRRAGLAASRAAIEQPLGVGVGDIFAVKRLGIPAAASRAKPHQGVRELGWAAFGEMARDLADRIADRFQPDVVLGIAKGGVFVGGALAVSLRAEFFPVRVEKRSRDRAAGAPDARADLPDLRGKRVLVVDDVAASGKTLEKARALARKAGAREVQAAVLVVRPGGAHPEWHALETDELTLFGWDYQLDDTSPGLDPGDVGV